MAVITKDLGAVSAYAVAVANGFTGTEAEWEQYMADAANNAMNAAGSATAAANSAASAAQSATEAATSKVAAAGSAVDAENSALVAGNHAAAAAASATAAETAETGAETAQTAAEAAQAAAEAVAASIPEDYTELSEEVGSLKSAIFNITDITFTDADFTIGTISSSNGQNNTSSKRARLNTAIYLRNGDEITVTTNKFAVYEYSDQSASTESYKGIVYNLTDGAGTYLVARSDWYRILLSFSDEATITSENIGTLIGTLEISAQVAKFVEESNAVTLSEQTLTDAQKKTARENIGAADKNSLFAYKDLPIYPYQVSRANLNSSTGAITGSNSKKVTTNFMYLQAGTEISVATGYIFYIYPYDNDRTYQAAGFLNNLTSYTVANNGFFRVSVLRTDGADIPDTDITTVCAGLSIRLCRNTALMPVDYEMIVPEFVPCASGRQLNIYHNNIIYGTKGNRLNKVLIDSNNFTSFDEFGRWEPSGTSGGSSTYIYAKSFFSSSLTFDDAKTFQIQRIGSDAGNGLTKNVMIIGDSLTGGYSTIRTELVALFADDAMSITLIGTKHESPYNSEARSGWGYNTYYNNQIRSGDAETNPFWNPSTEHFDFSYYKTQNPSIPDPDYVLLCLGTNDYGGYTIENTMTAADAIINSIHAYSADIKIALWLPPIPCSLQHNNTGASDMYKLIRALIGRYSGRQSEKLYTIPVYLAVDTKHDYRVEEVAIDARNTEYKMLVPTDNLHPTVAGLEKIADVLYSFVKYLGSVDET